MKRRNSTGCYLMAFVTLMASVAEAGVRWKRSFQGMIQVASTPDAEYIVVGCKPRNSIHTIQLFNFHGDLLWRIQLNKHEHLGGIGIRSDGSAIIFDYYRWQVSGIRQKKELEYSGGVRCISREGRLLWDCKAQSKSIGAPSASPLGLIHQVGEHLTLLISPWWEGISGWTILSATGRVIAQMNSKPRKYMADTIYMSPDESFLVLSQYDRVKCIEFDGRIRWEIPGALFPSTVPFSSDGNYILVRVGVNSFACKPMSKTWDRQFEVEQEIEGIGLANRHGLIVWGSGMFSFYSAKFPKFCWSAMKGYIIRRAEIAESREFIVVLHQLGAKRIVYKIPVHDLNGRNAEIECTELPSAISPFEVAHLAPNAQHVIIASEIRNYGKQGHALQIRLLNIGGVSVGETTIPKLSAKAIRGMLLSKEGKRVIITTHVAIYVLALL